MNGQNQENLKELFGRFFGPEQAGRAAEDVHKAEQILRENPAPEPDEQLRADIKWQIEEVLAARRRVRIFGPVAYRVAVAAAVIIVAAIGIRWLEKDGPESSSVAYASIIPTAVWESDDIVTDDTDLAILTAEMEQVENEVTALQLGQDEGNGERAATELEMELIEIGSDFWKG